jgi:hypothetical protein
MSDVPQVAEERYFALTSSPEHDRHLYPERTCWICYAKFLLAQVEQLTKERDEARLLFRERQRELENALLRCGQLALNRKTGAIQVFVKRTLGVEHFNLRSGQ